MLYDPSKEYKKPEITDDMILDLAADILERDGWCKQTSTNAYGQHCIMGALALAMKELDVCVDQLYMILCRVAGGNYLEYLASWNDLPSTTKEDVVNFLRERGRASQ